MLTFLFLSYIWDLGWHYGDEILQLWEVYACRVNRRSQVLFRPSLPGQRLGFCSRGFIHLDCVRCGVSLTRGFNSRSQVVHR